jgi:hypothetical protein
MEAMRSTWTDSRLDDLNDRVEGVRVEVQNLRGETTAGFRHVRDDIASLKRTMMQIGGGLIGTLVVGMLGLVGTQL